RSHRAARSRSRRRGFDLRHRSRRVAAWDRQARAAEVRGCLLAGRCRMTTVPNRTVEAVRDVLAKHADELGLDRETVKVLASAAVTARRRGGGLLRLDVSTYEPSEVS